MIGTHRHFGLLSNPWLVSVASVAALVLLGVLLWSPWDRPSAAGSRPLRLYCAAGMTRPIEEIIKAYGGECGVSVQPSYDGSGKLLSTIAAAGGQGDLYLASDASHMDKARQMGLVAEATPIARVYPVIIINTRTQEALTAQGRPVQSAADLLRDDLKVVLANAELASIGQLTRDVLKPSGIWAKLEEGLRDRSARVSTVGTVQEVAQIVRTRDGYAGVVWSYVARQQEGLAMVAVPEFEGVNEQLLIGVLTRSEQPAAALQFARYLTARGKGREVLEKYGLEPVAGTGLGEKD
jgi:molybdate transport system substrate-binding protein